MDGAHGVQRLTMKGYSRSHRRRTFILKTLEPRTRKSPVQTILILLIESGLVFLVIQVSYFISVPADMREQDPQSSHLSDRQCTC